MQLLSQGFGGSVYTLSNNLVAKVIDADHMFNVWVEQFSGELSLLEIECLKWANSVNDLVVKYKGKKEDDKEILIAMERIYPVLSTSFSVEELSVAIGVAERQLEELWVSGLAHGDLKRPDCVLDKSGATVADLYNNIAITEVNGSCVIRLIDLGLSALDQYSEDEDDCLDLVIEKDRCDWNDWKQFILNYPRNR